MINCLQPVCKNPTLLGSSFFPCSHSQTKPYGEIHHYFSFNFNYKCCKKRRICKKRGGIVCLSIFPVDPWAPTIDSQSIASQLFAVSLFPYIGFLYFITKSKSAPKLTLFGFYFLLAFVGATIPAGIYAKVHYGTSLSNVDWLHGGAESLLTLTNLFIVLGLRDALRKANEPKESTNDVSATKNKKNPLL